MYVYRMFKKLTSSSNRTTFPWALVSAVSRISICVLCSCNVTLCAANSISCRSFAATCSLSVYYQQLNKKLFFENTYFVVLIVQ